MIHKEATTCVCNHFNEDYFDLHQHLLSTGDQVGSRNGSTREILNFKTVIKEPIKRCIGGYNRNINVFFLLAEALWIWAGRRDVAFLDTFNGQLKQYSDDGVSYHAPYGWRMRKYGVDTLITANEENHHAFQGTDQIEIALKMLSVNPEDRRVVISIWDVNEDLNKTSRDICCNDMIMFKIRNGLLYTTIQNRSNDLNLGLTTNVFQFSFVSEIMSKILGVGLGDQVHNSQSLHLYLNHELTSELSENINEGNKALLYDIANASSMDFSFVDDISVDEKLRMVDFHIESIISVLSQKAKTKTISTSSLIYLDSLKQFSRYLYYVTQLLLIYTDYKQLSNKVVAIHNLQNLSIEMPEFAKSDYHLLAMNFFAQRILNNKNKDDKSYILNLVESVLAYKEVANY